MMAATTLAHEIRYGDALWAYAELAADCVDTARRSSERALSHAWEGDLYVAYDEASDVRIAWAYAGVAVAAWAATLANLGAHERAMRLDCASTDGEQLAIVETREAPRCVGCGDTGFVQVPGHPGEPPENVLCACQQAEEARRC